MALPNLVLRVIGWIPDPMKSQHHEWFHRQALFRFRSCSRAGVAVCHVAFSEARLIWPTFPFLELLV